MKFNLNKIQKIYYILKFPDESLMIAKTTNLTLANNLTINKMIH